MAGGTYLEAQFLIVFIPSFLSSVVELVLILLAVVCLVFFLSPLFQSIYYGVLWYGSIV